MLQILSCALLLLGSAAQLIRMRLGLRCTLQYYALCSIVHCAIECNVVQLIAVQVYYAVQWNDMDSRL